MQHEGLENRFDELQQTFQALFLKSPIGIASLWIATDENGKPIDYYFLDANENYRQLTGVDPRGKWVTEAFPNSR